MKDVVIKVRGLTKVYPKESHPALKSVDLEVKKGDIFGIIGMSGAGKSTLVRLLCGLETPTQGTLTIDGEKGMIFQHFNLFSSKTALENVLFPLEVEGKKDLLRASQLLTLVGLEKKMGAYPATLSGGEKQRVAIARALANSPQILFSDEATSALDPKSTRAILELLLHLNKTLGLTIVLITHQMEVIKQICTKMAVLSEGEIVEQGSVADLFAAPSHKVTKQLLRTLSHDIPPHFFPKESNKVLLRLTFKGKTAGEPIISKMIKEFAIDVNILLGGIDMLQEAPVGSLILEFSGKPEEIEKAKAFLSKNQVHFEEVLP